jgi:hypothetical protein
MVSQVENSDILVLIFKSLVKVIGRRSSEAYAVVMVNNVVKKLAENYDFLRYVTIKNPQHLETGDLITVESTINTVPPDELRDALRDLLTQLTTSIGETAGYFFIKELNDNLGPENDLALQNMGIDLDFMQLKTAVDKKVGEPLPVTDTSALFKRVVQALIDVLEKEINRDYAISTITNCFEALATEYEFFKNVTLLDTRYTLKTEIASVPQDISTAEPTKVGEAIEKLLMAINKSLEEKDIYSFPEKFKKHLSAEYLSALGKMGVNLKTLQVSHEAIFRHVIKALIDVLSKASTPRYAVLARVFSSLRKARMSLYSG